MTDTPPIAWPAIKWSRQPENEIQFERFNVDCANLPTLNLRTPEIFNVSLATYRLLDEMIGSAVWQTLDTQPNLERQQVMQYLSSQVVQHYRAAVSGIPLKSAIRTNLAAIVLSLVQQMQHHSYAWPARVTAQVIWHDMHFKLNQLSEFSACPAPELDPTLLTAAARRTLVNMLNEDSYTWFVLSGQELVVSYWINDMLIQHVPFLVVVNQTQKIVVDIVPENQSLTLAFQARHRAMNLWCLKAYEHSKDPIKSRSDWLYFAIEETELRVDRRFSEFF